MRDKVSRDATRSARDSSAESGHNGSTVVLHLHNAINESMSPVVLLQRFTIQLSFVFHFIFRSDIQFARISTQATAMRLSDERTRIIDYCSIIVHKNFGNVSWQNIKTGYTGHFKCKYIFTCTMFDKTDTSIGKYSKYRLYPART